MCVLPWFQGEGFDDATISIHQFAIHQHLPINHKDICLEVQSLQHVRNEKKPGCLGCIDDYTTHLCGDCNNHYKDHY